MQVHYIECVNDDMRFDPMVHSDLPLYNMQAVVQATNVSALTLRSWERRYGVPSPARDAHGARLYSDRDLATIRWLRRRLAEGLQIGRAVQLLGDRARLPIVHAIHAGDLVSELVDSMVQMDERAMSAVMGHVLTIFSVETAVLTVVQPALYTIGDLWARGELSSTVERFASAQVRAHLGQLMHLTPPPIHSGVLFVGCAAGELHEIGPFILALCLRRRGFNVVYAGANLEAESLRLDVLRLSPVAVCLSASTLSPAHALRTLYRTLSEQYDGLLVFGGQAFDHSPELVASMPGQYLGGDTLAAVTVLDGLLSSRARP